MLQEIRNHFIEFTVVFLILGGIFYSVTTSYKTNVKVESILEEVSENGKSIKKLKEEFALRKLNEGVFTEEDIKSLLNSKSAEDLRLKMKALEEKSE